MSDIRYLTLAEAHVLCRQLGDLKVRDLGLLDSALHRPRSGFGGAEVYPTVPLKAAALLHSIANNHALVDGNKRLAWMACVVFLGRHGYRPALSHAEAIALVQDVAGGSLADVAEIADRLRISGGLRQTPR